MTARGSTLETQSKTSSNQVTVALNWFRAQRKPCKWTLCRYLGLYIYLVHWSAVSKLSVLWWPARTSFQTWKQHLTSEIHILLCTEWLQLEVMSLPLWSLFKGQTWLLGDSHYWCLILPILLICLTSVSTAMFFGMLHECQQHSISLSGTIRFLQTCQILDEDRLAIKIGLLGRTM